jgi:hypothetical protein
VLPACRRVNERPMTVKKTISHANGDTTTQTSTEATALPLAYAPPTVGAPATPTGWTKSKWVKPREGLRPMTTQSDATAPAAAELQRSTTYVADFGANAPPAAEVAQNLLSASAWRAEWEKAGQWLAYCTEQRRIWEDKSLEDVATLKPAYDYAVTRDPTVAKRYPSTKLLVGARSEVSTRAAARKKAGEAAKAQQAAASVAPSPPGGAAPAAVAKSTTLN